MSGREGAPLTPNLSNKVILFLASIVAIVGVIDAWVDADWDLGALFGLILVLLVVLWARLSYGRPAVPLRADLVGWLDERAVSAGESIEGVADRAVSAYRAGLTVSADDAGDED